VIAKVSSSSLSHKITITIITLIATIMAIMAIMTIMIIAINTKHDK
jgi:hypothetical protein